MAKTTKSASRTARPGKSATEHAKRDSAAMSRRKSAGDGAARSAASASRSWGWETLAGVIGEKCFRAADSMRQEVARWWYDPQEATRKFRWKAGSTEGRNASPADAREQILIAL